MRRFYSSALAGAFFLTGNFVALPVNSAEIETQPSGLSLVVTSANTAGGGLNLYKMESGGSVTLLQEDIFHLQL